MYFQEVRIVMLFYQCNFSFKGMFPYVGLATMFIFCDFDWPRKLFHKITRNGTQTTNDMEKIDVSVMKKCLIVFSITFYVFMQLFMPFSHFITKVIKLQGSKQRHFVFILSQQPLKNSIEKLTWDVSYFNLIFPLED